MTESTNASRRGRSLRSSVPHGTGQSQFTYCPLVGSFVRTDTCSGEAGHPCERFDPDSGECEVKRRPIRRKRGRALPKLRVSKLPRRPRAGGGKGRTRVPHNATGIRITLQDPTPQLTRDEIPLSRADEAPAGPDIELPSHLLRSDAAEARAEWSGQPDYVAADLQNAAAEIEYAVDDPRLAVETDSNPALQLGSNGDGPSYEIVQSAIESSLVDLDAGVSAHEADIGAPQEGPGIPEVPFDDVSVGNPGVNPSLAGDHVPADPFGLPGHDPLPPDSFAGGLGPEPFGG